MLPNRRHIAILSAVAVVGWSATAVADEWPTQSITILVGYPAGGANDTVARGVAPGMSEVLGQPVVVENRAGAAGIVGAEAAARAEPDGYTLYMMSSAQTLAPSLHDDLPYDPVDSFEPIALGASGPYLLLVHSDVEADTVQELIELARENPGQINFASSGIGAGPHLTGEYFQTLADISLNHVPYRGDADAIADLLGGRVDLYFAAVAPSIPHVESGAVRALAITGLERHDRLPDVPTVEEAAGFEGFDMGAWWGLVAPAGTPEEILRRAEEAMKAALEDEDLRGRLAGLGYTVGDMGRDEFVEFVPAEVEKFRLIVEQAGVTLE
jgi:tripartite-type tricarboxylate transporter receptor subunit TctC